MYKFRCILISHFAAVLLVISKPLVGRLNFCGCLISRFYPTRSLRKFDARDKYMFYSTLSYHGLNMQIRWSEFCHTTLTTQSSVK